MASQILVGSTGTYKPLNSSNKQFGDTSFVVTQDTCGSLDYVVCRFKDGLIDVRIKKSQITWKHLITKDFQGA